MRIALYYVATVLFIASAVAIIFALDEKSKPLLELSIDLAKAGGFTIFMNSVLDFGKYLLRMGEYNTPK